MGGNIWLICLPRFMTNCSEPGVRASTDGFIPQTRKSKDSNCTPTPLSMVVAVTVSKMAAPQSGVPGNEGSCHGLLHYFQLETFMRMTIIWLVRACQEW